MEAVSPGVVVELVPVEDEVRAVAGLQEDEEATDLVPDGGEEEVEEDGALPGQVSIDIPQSKFLLEYFDNGSSNVAKSFCK